MRRIDTDSRRVNFATVPLAVLALLISSCSLVPRMVGFAEVQVNASSTVYLKYYADMSFAVSLNRDPCEWPRAGADYFIDDTMIHYAVQDGGLILFLYAQPKNSPSPRWTIPVSVVVQEPIEFLRFMKTDAARNIREFRGNETKVRCHW